MTYTTIERDRASRWKAATDCLPQDARAAATYRGRNGTTEHPFCLPAPHAAHNLLPDVRDDALALFDELGIPWHAGVKGGPSNHLLSSQVQCVNALARMVKDPARVVRAFGGSVDIAEVLEIEPGRFLTFEYIGPRDLLGEQTGERRTRGANCTSVDAAFEYRTSDGRRELALVEWKYTEFYRRRKTNPEKDLVRAGRYQHLYDDGAGPLKPVVPFALMLDEPFYQLMRQQLLAWRLEQEDLGFDRVRVLHVLSPANAAYQQSVVRDEMKALGSTVDEIWAKLLRRPSGFVHVDPTVFLDPHVTSDEYVARYGHG